MAHKSGCKGRYAIITGLAVALGLSLSCDFVIEPPTPVAPAPGGESGVGESLPDWEALTLTPPATAPLASAFPLPADLFYLNDSGQLWRQPLEGGEGSAELISRPEQVIRDFAVSPGGGHYVYRVSGDLAIASLNGAGNYPVADGVGEPVETSRGRTIAWSPDASRIAYITPEGFRISIAPEWGLFDVMETTLVDLAWSPDARWLLVWRQDNTAVLYDITETATRWAELAAINGYAWLDDGRLAFAPTTGGLAVLTPADLTSRTFIVTTDYVVTMPMQRQDGSLAFFLHEGSTDAPGFLYLADIAGTYSPASSIPVETNSKSWTPDGLRLIGVNDEQMIVLLDPLTGAVATFGTEGALVSLDWGDVMPPEVAGMRLPSDLYFLRPTDGTIGVWRLPADGSLPEPVIVAPTDIVDYDVAPDGLRIVLTTSDGAIHLANTRGSQDILAIEAVPPTFWPQPAFSPDGRGMVYVNQGIWLLDLTTGEVRQLLQDDVDENNPRRAITYRNPRWSPNGNWLLVDVGYFEGFDVALLSVLDENPEPLLLEMFGATAEWTPSGQVLLYSAGDVYAEPGLVLAVPGETPVIEQLLSMPILEAQAPRGGRLGLLRTSLMGPSPWEPTVQVFSATPAGGDIRPESDALTLEAPIFSPDATILAGLKSPTRDSANNLIGRLTIFNIQTGEMFLIEGMDSARALQWAEP